MMSFMEGFQITMKMQYKQHKIVLTNKLLAKMAGDLKKPNLVHTLFPEEIEEKMWPLNVEDLFFVGRATERQLKRLGINTIGKLAKAT